MPNQAQKLKTALYHFYERPVAKASLELFLTVLAVIFFAVFAIRPTLITMSDLVKEIEDKRKLDQQMTQKIAALSSAQNSYSTIESRLPILEQAIPMQVDLINDLKIIEKTASDQGLVIDAINVNEIPTLTPNLDFLKAERKAYTISVLIQGDYPSIRQLVENILSQRRVFVVDTIVFSTSEERGLNKLRANLTLSVPYFGAKSL